jgi:hypothetical protein
MEAVGLSETSVNLCRSSLLHILADITCRRISTFLDFCLDSCSSILKMEAVGSSETSVNVCRTTRLYIPADITLHRVCMVLEFLFGFFCFYPEYGGSRFLRNVGKRLPDYTALHPCRYNSSQGLYGCCIFVRLLLFLP